MIPAPAIAPVSIRRILFATDFSLCSERALTYLLPIAAANQSYVYILHVLPPATPPAPTTDFARNLFDFNRHEAEKRIRALENSGALWSLQHEILLESGDLWEAVVEMIWKHDIDLIVVGTRGRGGIRKLVLGSVAEQISRHASCPVLTVGPQAPAPASGSVSRRILYATDYSAGSLHALPYALSFAYRFQAHLTLLHVTSTAERGRSSRRESILWQERERLLALLPAELHLPSPASLIVEIGSPAEVILKTATDSLADLLVMGVRPTQAITAATHLPWNVAHQVVCGARCPVLTVRG